MTYLIKEIRLSHSTITGLLESCERKYEFVKMMLHSKRDESLPGEVGNALHTGYQEYFLNKDRTEAMFKMMLRYPSHLNSNPFNNRSVEACYATLNAMIDSHQFFQYEIANIKCLDNIIRPAIEVPFEIIFKGQSILLNNGVKLLIRYVGFVDMILYDKMNDEYIVVDIKTTREDPEYYDAMFRYDEQVLPYAIVLEKVLGHKLNNIKVKYMVVYVDIKKPSVHALEYIKSRQDIEDWGRKQLLLIKKLDLYISTEWFPRQPKACFTWRRKCGFHDICHLRNVDVIQEQILQDEKPYVDTFPEPWIALDLELEAA